MINVIYYEISTGKVISQTHTIEGSEEDIRPLWDKTNDPKELAYLNDRAIEKVDGAVYDSDTDTITITPVADPTQTTTQVLKKMRNNRLTNSDWTQAVDSPLLDSKKAEWATYRQALRDLPTSYSDSDNIEDVVFPTPPS
tara:strand:- start:710 stop:1129 length:420 start_codon:yes stop_codon:yes gene_type:complete